MIEPGHASSRAARPWASAASIGPHTTARDATIGDGATVIHSFVLEAEVGAGREGRPVRLPPPRARRSARAPRSAPSWRSRTPTSAPAPRSRTSPTSATPTSARRRNLGASTITANYDGSEEAPHEDRKEREDRHPHLARRARSTSATGRTLALARRSPSDVPEGALGIAREKQKNIEGYADRVEEDSSNEQAPRDGRGAGAGAEHRGGLREAADDHRRAGEPRARREDRRPARASS